MFLSLCVLCLCLSGCLSLSLPLSVYFPLSTLDSLPPPPKPSTSSPPPHQVTLADTMAMREPVMAFCFEFFDALEAAEQALQSRKTRDEDLEVEQILKNAHLRDFDYTILQDRLRKAHAAILRVIEVNMTEKNRGKFCSLGSFFNTDDFIKRFFTTADLVSRK